MTTLPTGRIAHPAWVCDAAEASHRHLLQFLGSEVVGVTAVLGKPYAMLASAEERQGLMRSASRTDSRMLSGRPHPRLRPRKCRRVVAP